MTYLLQYYDNNATNIFHQYIDERYFLTVSMAYLRNRCSCLLLLDRHS